MMRCRPGALSAPAHGAHAPDGDAGCGASVNNNNLGKNRGGDGIPAWDRSTDRWLGAIVACHRQVSRQPLTHRKRERAWSGGEAMRMAVWDGTLILTSANLTRKQMPPPFLHQSNLSYKHFGFQKLSTSLVNLVLTSIHMCCGIECNLN